MPLLTKNSLPSSSLDALGRRELLIAPGSILLKICPPPSPPLPPALPPTAETGAGNCHLLYQISVRKYEDDLEH